ncbi:PD-(D/E)XK nuclease family protein [uncultured Enterovirga sp.]|uniref:PD-(D/E)XK nuclease family protein n=1 Tax=uncultured Enterovirga sp. TaxID=2026352 RepID=UPI0035CC7D55
MEPIRKTVIIQGSLAYATRRAAAARAGENGLQIMTASQLAARLAGGFSHEATVEDVEHSVRNALDLGGFEEIERVRHLPGITRAIARTLRKAWHADLRLSERARSSDSARVRDLALVERRTREQLPAGALLPDALRDAACGRAHVAASVLGDLSIEGVHSIDPLWRPLFHRLCADKDIPWRAPVGAETGWFPGTVTNSPTIPAPPIPDVVTCANPRHEVLEALRWARGLLATGRAAASAIAITSVATDEWDDHVLSLAREAGVRVSFPHGIACLSTADGQLCAALADAVLNGLSQHRVRRLLALAAGQHLALGALPRSWLQVPRGATLNTVAEWARVLEYLPPSDLDPRSVVLPLLAILEKGSAAAEDAANAFLRGRARRLWERATRAAPAVALELTLRTLRIPDEHDSADAVVWCPAWQLAAAPRPWMRLLGVTSRGWPRWFSEDPLLPRHIVSTEELDADPPTIGDRRAFRVIGSQAAAGLVLSRSRRNAQGALTGPSPLLPSSIASRDLARDRLPEHALSEADRIAARPQEALRTAPIAAATQCWRDWHNPALTPHDGLIAAGHPAIARTITGVQSPTSLTRLLRDPLGFVWRYALGWSAEDEREQPLTLAPDDFGRLVHELLRRTVDALEPTPGFTVAHEHEIADALEAAVRVVTASWPLARPVPPQVLWVNTVRQAAEMSLAGLTREKFTEAGTRSWTEVPFGEAGSDAVGRSWPWDSEIPVTVPGTSVTIRGKIDRIDLRAAGDAVRVTDYKTGERPNDADARTIAGGAELQRVLYGLACRQLLPTVPTIRARLSYLRESSALYHLTDIDAAIAVVGEFVAAACAALESGRALIGIAAADRLNDLRLALPASPSYIRRKQQALTDATGDLARFWHEP